jgi:hypothetical protein
MSSFYENIVAVEKQQVLQMSVCTHMSECVGVCG